MKTTAACFMAVLGMAALAAPAPEAKRSGQLTYFVEGRDRAEGGFTVDAAVMVTADPANRRDWSRKRSVAQARLMERLTLTPEKAAQYAPPCVDPASLLRTPIMEEPEGCDFGDPACPDWKTYFNSPGGPYCTAAATNCQRVVRVGR